MNITGEEQTESLSIPLLGVKIHMDYLRPSPMMLKLDSFTNIDQKHFSWKQQGKAVQGSLNNLLNQFRQGNCIFEGLSCPSQGTHGQSDSLFASSNLLV
jgi:hypothetical protein